MKTRRQILNSFPLLATFPAIPQLGDEIAIATPKRIAQDLAAALCREHGGKWVVSVDSKNEFILVSKVIS